MDKNKAKYVVYCRRSQDSDERQVLSNESQAQEIEVMIKRLGIKNDDVIRPFFEESASAKKSFQRPKLDKMLELIDSGKANGIIAWKANRLSRNAVDTGRIVELFDDKKLDLIITKDQIYHNTNMERFMFQLACLQAKTENDGRAEDSTRGMLTKAKMGWYPAQAPIGYKNEVGELKGFKTISKDQESWKLVRLCFKSILEGEKPFEVLKKAQEIWKLKGRNGNVIAESTFYNMLGNPFYYGRFEWAKGSGNWYQGKHEPVVTEEEFNKIQILLGRKGVSQPIKRDVDYLYTGMMKCAKCGATISADHKDKYYESTDRHARYIYYRCSRKAKTCDCDQPQISETNLEKIFSEILKSVRPPQGFVDWANKWLAEEHKSKSVIYQDIRQSQLKRKIEIEKQLDKLLTLYLSEGIEVEVYKAKKEEYESERRILEEKIKENDGESDEHRRKIENALDFAESAYQKFHSAKTLEEKRFLIRNLGANLTLDDKNVRIKLKKYLQTSKNKDNWDEQFSDWCEPPEYKELLGKNKGIRPPKSIWLPL